MCVNMGSQAVSNRHLIVNYCNIKQYNAYGTLASKSNYRTTKSDSILKYKIL